MGCRCRALRLEWAGVLKDGGGRVTRRVSWVEMESEVTGSSLARALESRGSALRWGSNTAKGHLTHPQHDPLITMLRTD